MCVQERCITLPKASLHHPNAPHKNTVPGKCVINVLFLVTLTFSQADVLKLTAVSVHMLLFMTALVR